MLTLVNLCKDRFKKYIPLGIVISFIWIIYYSFSQFIVYYDLGDSGTYWNFYFFNGRTPVYPAYLWVFKHILGDNTLGWGGSSRTNIDKFY